jgi:hypothetical protein
MAHIYVVEPNTTKWVFKNWSITNYRIEIFGKLAKFLALVLSISISGKTFYERKDSFMEC